MKGVNGQVKFAVARLGEEGMEIKGVNGNVEVRFRELVNADIDVKGNNGGLTLNMPNVTMQERESFSNIRARLGAGGAPIDIKGVNGRIRFESDATASSATPTTAPGAPTAPTAPAVKSAPAAPHDEAEEDGLEPPPAPRAPSE